MWERLGQIVGARRAELRLTREELAHEARVSSRVLGDIENARRTNFDATTLMRLESALGWRRGSVEAVLRGDDPELRPEPSPVPLPLWMARILAAYHLLPADEQARVDELGATWADWIEAVAARVSRNV